ncbi:DUF2497 domain-containing protein [Kaistia defluvii]|uniref:PopZ family protein n=1 Tax=Kaistia defluvii TaxID=410841 RepID=UPI00224F4FFA|nr:DUF2497 domain-containing protein [Kaistia defluvii]MCX5519560.1 DUF2497 domain-containing protein [Kaistia defluvii]
MAKVSAAQEPSMEEILASIRRIISEDEHGLAAPKASELTALPPKLPGVPVSAADIDALFSARVAEFAAPPAAPARTEAVTPEPAPIAPAAMVEPRMLRPAAPAPAPESVRAAEPARAAEPSRAPAPVRAEVAAPAPVSPARPLRDELPAGEPLLSPAADAIVHSAFGNLASTVQAGTSPTLEDLVKDMLRPMLKTWLDTNLPPLVERLVRDEIERVSRGR